jgi:transcriptional regulator with XRE-family HTH domain
MESLGRYFQECRVQRGMSLDEVSARTRIRLQTLQALERDDYPSLPVEVTVKGFVRAYARCLGLDEHDVLERYQRIATEYFRMAKPADPISRVKDTAAPEPVWKRHLTLAGLTVAVLAVVISGVVALMPSAPPDEPNAISAPGRVAPPVPPDPPAPARIPEPIQTIASVPAIPPPPNPRVSPPPRPAASGAVQELSIAASEPSWLQVTIDGGQPKEAILQPGERITWAAEREFRLTVGNAGGVSVALNGEPVGPLGPSGRVRTLVLPRPSTTVRPDPTPALTSSPDSITVPDQPFQ